MIYLVGTPPDAETAFDTAKRLASKKQKHAINCLELMLGVLTGALDSHKYQTFLVLGQHDTGIDYTEFVARAEQLSTIEPYIDNQQFLLTHNGNEFRLKPFGLLDVFRFDNSSPPNSGNIAVAKANIVQQTSFLREKTEALERLINKDDINEYQLQTFLKSHPQFLLGNEWQALHTQVILETEEAQETDFFMETVDSQFTDISDLKKTNQKPIVNSKNHRGVFSSALTNALNQLREYRNYFDDRDKQREFHEKYGFNAFHPHISVIIGRSHDFENYEKRMSIQNAYKSLKLLAYKDIINNAKRRQIITDQILSMPDGVNPANI